MKRFWFGVCLLAVLLAGCLGVSWGMERLHEPVSRNLEQAAILAQTGDLAGAGELTLQAQADWQKHWHFVAAFADHGPMEEIDALFGALEEYRLGGDHAEFAANCVHLARLTEAMAEAHALNWWNLL